MRPFACGRSCQRDTERERVGEIKTESDSLMKAGVNGGGNRYYISYA